jgi:hypothetical protein
LPLIAERHAELAARCDPPYRVDGIVA